MFARGKVRSPLRPPACISPTLLARLQARDVTLHAVTLHVGAGTFLPVKAVDTEAHHMHGEWGSVSAETADALNEVRRSGGRIVAVGSTSLRLSKARAATTASSARLTGETAMFITPGYRFRAVDVMHDEFSPAALDLFMLVSAFSGLDTMKRAYAHAIDAGYRFYSYGDACLLFPPNPRRSPEA